MAGVSAFSVNKYTKGITRDAKPPVEGDELWVQIEGFGGRYYISNHGRLFTTGYGSGSAKLIKPSDNGNGYLQAILSWDGKTKPLQIHRAVANAFCKGKSKTRNQVNHIDGCKSNNHAENLEWVTRSENMLHSARVLGNKRPCGCKSPTRKLSDEQVRQIRLDARTNEAIAKDYDICTSTVSNVRTGMYYRDVI